MPVHEDIYRKDVDFTALGLLYSDFSKRLKTNGQLDFSDPESVRQLTKALLRRDFNLTIDLPEDRLCPPVPNRFNYVLFAQKLVESTRPDYGDANTTSENVIGLDIGTGASAIYPLLACQQLPTWAFLTTEIDPRSRQYAEHNINSNRLQSRIKILSTDESGQRILPTSELQRFDDHRIRIQITNPPFYSSETEMIESAKKKSRPPNSACTGAPVEMIVDGGEVAFVSQLIRESMQPHNNTKIQWFSSMLGKLSSVSEVIEQLRKANCLNYAATEFIQGQKTRRWCVAWSWFSLRPPTALARGIPSLDKKVLPFPSDYDFEVDGHNVEATYNFVDSEVSKLDLEWHLTKDKGGIARSLTGDVWSRKARRRRLHDEEMTDAPDEGSSDEEDKEPALAFRIVVKPKLKEPSGSVVHIRWLQGQDAVLFESFCGWLKRKAQT